MSKKRDLAAGKNWAEMLRWFRSMTGRVIWLGISWPQNPEIHGYRFWSVVKVDRTGGGVDFVIFSDPVTQNQYRVAVECIWKAGEEEPSPEYRDYEKQWGRGLEKRPDVQEVIASASMAQATHHPEQWGNRPPLPKGKRL